MKRFADQAQEILDAAINAPRGSNLTLLVRADGSVHMLSECDWPLDSLLRHHGARAAYRVRHERDFVRVEGREGTKTCILEAPHPARAAQSLLLRG